MRLYVCGPVSGRPRLNRPAFERAALRLEEAGHAAILPHWFVPPDAEWQAAMRRCVETLVKCDGVALLADWQESKGARIECRLAKELGMQAATVDLWCGDGEVNVLRKIRRGYRA